ncbi:4369_t:CDS:10 [Diversispora eburnea]|uniref:Prolyl endopeptidase-like n=1 Tax=Diversispora eburnea TaxID=1213867 RepID=A0A9N8YKL5_9GLOM|nr:4369_t:CDS:10 [Diversispora eburnea]
MLKSYYKQLFLKQFHNYFQRTPPPIPKQVPRTSNYFGNERVDEFQWMQDPNDIGVQKYIISENRFTDKIMQNTKLLQKKLQYEMKKKLITPVMLPPVKTIENGYEYYTKPSLYDHNILAYLVEQEGNEVGTLYFKDLSRNLNFQQEKLEGVFNFLWGTNTHTIYYTVVDKQLRPYKVFAHKIGTMQQIDLTIFEENDQSAFVDITYTKDKSFIMINSNTFISSEVRFFDAHHDISLGKPNSTLIEARVPGLEYYGYFYILTNADNTKNFKLVRSCLANFGRKNWEIIYAAKESEKIEDVEIFHNYATIFIKREGLPVILCYNLWTLEVHQIELPDKFCVVSPGINNNYKTDIVRFTYSSPFISESIYDYNMQTRNLLPIRIHSIKVLVRSYGAYGISTEPEFQLEHFPLLERGWIIALAHVFLEYTNTSLISTIGISAGGLLAGTVYNMRPELFRTIIMKVPFLDPLSSMLDPNLPLTKVEYHEWGNPAESKEIYDYIASYTPYDNIKHYRPSSTNNIVNSSILVTAGMHDQRVNYWHPLKWIARMRLRQSDCYYPYLKNGNLVNFGKNNLLILKIDFDKGHFVGNNHSDKIKNLAFELAFLISQITKH